MTARHASRGRLVLTAHAVSVASAETAPHVKVEAARPVLAAVAVTAMKRVPPVRKRPPG